MLYCWFKYVRINISIHTFAFYIIWLMFIWGLWSQIYISGVLFSVYVLFNGLAYSDWFNYFRKIILSPKGKSLQSRRSRNDYSPKWLDLLLGQWRQSLVTLDSLVEAHEWLRENDRLAVPLNNELFANKRRIIILSLDSQMRSTLEVFLYFPGIIIPIATIFQTIL